MTNIKRKVSKREGKDREVDKPDDNEDASEHNNEDKDDDSEDVAIEADANDPEAMAATMIVDYDPGDAPGKLMALVNQLQMSSEGTRKYLFHTCIMQNVKPIELLLWIRT